MKWTTKYYNNGDIRTRKHFCLFPLGFSENGITTWYWLETVVITEKCYACYAGFDENFWVCMNIQSKN